jgi:putative peptidoglycan lipid II flippase
VAAARGAAATAVALPLMFALDRYAIERLTWLGARPGDDLRLGAVGLALGASLGAWLERLALGRALGRRLPGFAPRPLHGATRALLAAVAVIPAGLAARWTAENHPSVRAVCVFGGLGAVYLALALALRLPECRKRGSIES